MWIGLSKRHKRGHWVTMRHLHNILRLVSLDASKQGHDQRVRCTSRDQAYETQACNREMRLYQLSVNMQPSNDKRLLTAVDMNSGYKQHRRLGMPSKLHRMANRERFESSYWPNYNISPK